ncbi:MAG: hypothetical protein ABI359_14430 [Ginsengibacter sp.]
MIKKPFLLAFIFLITTTIYAQSDTTKVEQYCELFANPVLFSKNLLIDANFGVARKFWSDDKIKEETNKLKKFNSLIDAMNYLGAQGWKYVNCLRTEKDDYHYIFRKEFLKSELKEVNN